MSLREQIIWQARLRYDIIELRKAWEKLYDKNFKLYYSLQSREGSQAMLKFAKVKFTNSYKMYDYICELEDIKKADKVYVPTREGTKIVEVCGIFYADLSEMPLPAYRYKKVWGKVPENVLVEKPEIKFELKVKNYVQMKKPKQSFGPISKKKAAQKAVAVEENASVSQNATIEDKPEQTMYTYDSSDDETIREQEKKLMIKEIFIMLVINAFAVWFLYNFTRVFK